MKLALIIILFLSISTTNAQWVLQNNNLQDYILRGINFISADIGFIVGSNGIILKTNDEGETWVTKNSGTTEWLNAVFFTDINNGIAVGENGTILNTYDGGEVWNLKPNGTLAALFNVSFIDNNNGFIVGTWGTLLKTTDGGNSWISKNLGQLGWQLRDISIIDQNNAFIVGNADTASLILNTKDGGDTWTYQSIDTIEVLFGVTFQSANIGTVSGEYGTILKTSDGGITWNSQISGTLEFLTDLSFSDHDNGTIVGTGGVILRTTDGGTNWSSQNIGTTHGLNGVYFITQENGIAIGDGGTILKTTNGGITSVHEEEKILVAADFLLAQNYPNPFNPNTTISYSIPVRHLGEKLSLLAGRSETSEVKLVVYDVIGKEIKVLVNRYQQPGNYKVEFDGSKLSSGIYFYRLQVYSANSGAGALQGLFADKANSATGNFVQTKKMIVLK